MKEQLKEIWTQTNEQEAEEVLDDWIKQAKESKIPQLINMADTLSAHRTCLTHRRLLHTQKHTHTQSHTHTHTITHAV